MCQLIRAGAERLLQSSDTAFRELDHAILSIGNGSPPQHDLVEAARRSNRAHLLRWATGNVRAPGAPVAPEQGEDVRTVLRGLAHRGLGDRALHAYRIGQNVIWRRWMAIAFTLTDDADELRGLLDITSRSLTDYIDTALGVATAVIAKERDRLTRSIHAERLDLVTAILREADGIDPVHAGERLDYRLDGTHTAIIVHCASRTPKPGDLEDAAHLLAESVSVLKRRKPLTVLAGPATLWAWLPVSYHPNAATWESVLDGHPDFRVAIGTTAFGLEGFRYSHHAAEEVRRLLENPRAPHRVADHDSVQAVVLATRHLESAQGMVRRVLGPLARHPDLCVTLRAYLAHQGNAAATARTLFLHRNTVLGRLAKAERLLPRPLQQNILNVGLALEILFWCGHGPSFSPSADA